MTSYIVVHPQPIYYRGIVSILEQKKNINCKCIGFALHPKEVMLKVSDWIADMMIIGIQAKSLEEIRLIEAVKKKSRHTRILMIAGLEYVDVVRQGFIKGANGFIAPNSTDDDFIDAVDRILHNEVVMPAGFRIHPDLNDVIFLPKIPSKYEFHLTLREKEVLQLICQGLNNKSISQQLFISDQTVAVHRKNLFRKLEVKNSIALMQKAREKKLIS